MRRLLKNILVRMPDNWRMWAGFIRGYLFPLRQSASQYGEDLIIEAALETLFGISPKTVRGTYVDVGAFHPRFSSNTWRLARYGWNGVVVDFPAAKINGFRIRRNCIPVAAAIGEADGGELTVYRQPTLLSAIDSASREHLASYPGVSEIFEDCVPVRSLEALLTELKITQVDVLSIDIEGLDITALRGLGPFRPKVIVIEDASPFPELNADIELWMSTRAYRLYARTGVSLIYCRTGDTSK